MSKTESKQERPRMVPEKVRDVQRIHSLEGEYDPLGIVAWYIRNDVYHAGARLSESEKEKFASWYSAHEKAGLGQYHKIDMGLLRK